jgi:hypothetical protein
MHADHERRVDRQLAISEAQRRREAKAKWAEGVNYTTG